MHRWRAARGACGPTCSQLNAFPWSNGAIKRIASGRADELQSFVIFETAPIILPGLREAAALPQVSLQRRPMQTPLVYQGELPNCSRIALKSDTLILSVVRPANDIGITCDQEGRDDKTSGQTGLRLCCCSPRYAPYVPLLSSP